MPDVKPTAISARGAETTPAASPVTGPTGPAASPTASPAPGPTEAPPLTSTPGPDPTFAAPQNPTPTSAPQATATRLASHLFVPVGATRSISGFGRLTETIALTEPPAVEVAGNELTAVDGGISCLRFQYRTSRDENNVQTLCVVVFEETGDCEGMPPLRLDLQMFLAPAEDPHSNANLLESGDGLFYAACQTDREAYRLQVTDTRLPTLYLTIVDALGDGPYSLGSDELDAQRAGAITTYAGQELTPPWIVSLSLEVTDLYLADDLRVDFSWEDCSVSPACTLDFETVRAGDVVRISVGLDEELLAEAYGETNEDLRDRFFTDRIGIGWPAIAQVHPDARRMAFNRLAAVDIMASAISYFDRVHGLRDKGAIVAYWQPWTAQTPLPFPFVCFPDSIAPGETERCTRIEDGLRAREADVVAALEQDGYTLWHAAYLDYRQDGEYVPLSDRRPHFSLFRGIVAGIGANSTYETDFIPSTLAGVVASFAAEVGNELPVLVTLNGPPITAQTGGPFCEADICPSDFSGMYRQAEAILNAALQSLTADQLAGFGVSVFEGSHFDIRDPYEKFVGFALNRVGETGYNNPVLNAYRAR